MYVKIVLYALKYVYEVQGVDKKEPDFFLNDIKTLIYLFIIFLNFTFTTFKALPSTTLTSLHKKFILIKKVL